jgi:hypothetical protein
VFLGLTFGVVPVRDRCAVRAGGAVGAVHGASVPRGERACRPGALGLIAAASARRIATTWPPTPSPGAHFLLGLDWTTSLLVGAILAGGDPGGGAAAAASTLAFDRRFLEEVDQVAERENSAHNALGAVQIQHLAVSLESVPGCRERGQAAAVQE